MNKSLEEVNQSVNTEQSGKGWRRFFAFAGPAYMVSVGYMDPGNWATDIAGGSKFGYSLLWVLLMSNLIALLLQSHCSRLGIVYGKDLAQASRENYPKVINLFLYALAEIAIAACDLAEVVGMAIGLQLLFNIPLLIGIVITVLDTFLLLFLLNYGIRKLEAFIIFLVSLIGLSFVAQMFFAQPSLSGIISGFIPTLKNSEALMIAVGLIGATVMPHNLYLHSSLVQTRKFERTSEGIKKAIRYNFLDSAIALNAALFVNAAILILSSAAFFDHGYRNVEDIKEAHSLLAPLLGTVAAPILFAVALIASGQSSTVTGTLAGQIIMEGYLNLRIQPWLRRIITRVIAIVPATLVIIFYGEDKTIDLLVFSQVILSLQLGFAVVPLIHFVSDKKIMGSYAIGIWSKLFSWISATVIIGLNLNYLFNILIEGLENPKLKWWIILLICPIVSVSFLILIYLVLRPIFKKQTERKMLVHHKAKVDLSINIPDDPKNILIAVDFSDSDEKAIAKALMLGGKEADYILVHVVETVAALVVGKDAMDHETESDRIHLEQYCSQLMENGYKVRGELGFGNPKKSIPELVKKLNADILIMGGHGHKGIKDLIFGTTVERVRHNVDIPVVIV
ncbi:MAG: Nramp family divalent metal transporter [Bacteroidota bacterium]